MNLAVCWSIPQSGIPPKRSGSYQGRPQYHSEPISGPIGNMDDTTTQTEEQVTAPPTPAEDFVRPVADRMVAGVAQGVAQRFGAPTWVIRLAFIVSAFVGGLGIVAYLAIWGLVRSEDEADSPLERFFASDHSANSWIGVAIITVGALILLGNVTFLSGEFLWSIGLIVIGILLYTGYINGPSGSDAGDDGDDNVDKEGVQPVSTTTDTLVAETKPSGDSPSGGAPTVAPTPAPPPPRPVKPRETSILGRLTIGLALVGMGVLAILDQIDAIPIDADPRHYLALTVTIIGVGLIVGAILGRARWLIIVAAFLVPMLLFSPAFEYDWSEDTFDTVFRPTSFNGLQQTYQQDVGNMVIDLTDLPWNGQMIEIEASVDLGNLEVRVPENVSIVGRASVDVGRAAGPLGESFGFGDPSVALDWPGDAGSVDLDLTVDVGNVEVRLRPATTGVTP